MTTHRIDLFSLVAGIVTVAIAVLALVDGFTLDLARWVLPVLLIGTGALVLGAVVTNRRSDAAADGAAVGDAEDDLPLHHREALTEARAEVEALDPTTDQTA